jgi:hypothetical protein
VVAKEMDNGLLQIVPKATALLIRGTKVPAKEPHGEVLQHIFRTLRALERPQQVAKDRTLVALQENTTGLNLGVIPAVGSSYETPASDDAAQPRVQLSVVHRP